MKLYFGNGVTTATTILLLVLVGYLGYSIWNGCVGAALIFLAAIATPLTQRQEMREVWFYLLSGGVLLKIFTIEISRLFLR